MISGINIIIFFASSKLVLLRATVSWLGQFIALCVASFAGVGLLANSAVIAVVAPLERSAIRSRVQSPANESIISREYLTNTL